MTKKPVGNPAKDWYKFTPAPSPLSMQMLARCLAMDLGPDGQSGVNALLWKFHLNLLKMPDFDHLVQRALLEALTESELMEFLLLIMVALNVDQGPNDNDIRYKQKQEANERLQQKHNARSCVPQACLD